MHSNRPILNSRLFWDVIFDEINYQTHARFVIERVFERGDVEDIRQCRRFYGDEKIAEILLTAKSLPLPTIYLAAALLNRELNEFECYTNTQLNPLHFSY